MVPEDSNFPEDELFSAEDNGMQPSKSAASPEEVGLTADSSDAETASVEDLEDLGVDQAAEAVGLPEETASAASAEDLEDLEVNQAAEAAELPEETASAASAEDLEVEPEPEAEWTDAAAVATPLMADAANELEAAQAPVEPPRPAAPDAPAERQPQSVRASGQRPPTGYQRRKRSWFDRGMQFGADFWAWWKRRLRWVRSQLPPTMREQLTDQVLTAVVLGVLVLLVLVNPLGIGRSASVDVAQPSPVVEETAEVAAADDAAAPELEVSPEASRIAEIQEKVAAITQSTVAGLVEAVQANFRQGVLVVKVSGNWYGLMRSQQDQVAQSIYAQSADLAFLKLYLQDADGNLVARSPVVGDQMVILRRHRDAGGLG